MSRCYFREMDMITMKGKGKDRRIVKAKSISVCSTEYKTDFKASLDANCIDFHGPISYPMQDPGRRRKTILASLVLYLISFRQISPIFLHFRQANHLPPLFYDRQLNFLLTDTEIFELSRRLLPRHKNAIMSLTTSQRRAEPYPHNMLL